MPQNIGTHTVIISVYLKIGIPQYTQTQAVKIVIPDLVCRLPGRFIVLGTIQLNDDFGFCAIEISDVISEHFLPVERNGKCFEKIIPKVPFLFGHVFSQLFCICGQLRIICFVHGRHLIRLLLRKIHLLLKEKA